MKKAISYLLILTLTFTMLFSGVSFSFAAETPRESDSVAGEAYVEDEVLVVFEDEISQNKAETIVEDADVAAEDVEEIAAPVSEETPEATPYVVTLDEKETSVEDAVEELDKDSDVAYAQPNYLYPLEDDIVQKSASKRSISSKQWNLEKIDTQEAWDLIDQVKGTEVKPEDKVTVAVLDTGVDLNDDNLQTALEKYKDQCVDVTEEGNKGNEQFEDGVYNKLDPNLTPSNSKKGHGTRVSGMIAASNGSSGLSGVASGNHQNLVDLVVVDIYKTYESADERFATSADIVRGIEYVTGTGDSSGSENTAQDPETPELNAKVINMSIGFTANRSGENDQYVQDAINTAVEGGTTIVCSAGNDNTKDLWYPSDMANVIGVISTKDYTDAFEQCKADTSNYGSNKDICAPGSHVPVIVSSAASNGYSSGTSYASPTVAGVAAMMYYVNPDITPAEILEKMKSTATDLYTDGDDQYTRCGNVNAYGAVASAAGVEIDNTPKALSAPIGVKASSAGYNKVKVSWNKVSGASGYYIYRSKSANGNYTKVHTVSGGSSTSYTNSGLTSGVPYYFKVMAYGTSDNKKTYSVQSSAASAAPVIASPTGLYVSCVTYKKQKIEWDKLANASGYAIYRSTSKNGTYKCIKTITSGSTTSFTSSSGITPGKTYYYKIRAYRTNRDGDNAYGTYSSAKSRRAAPKKPTIYVTKYGSRSAKVRWNKVSTVSGFAVYRSQKRNSGYKRVKLKKAGIPRYVISRNMKKNKRYYFKVRAYKTYNGKRIYSLYSTPKSIRVK